MWKDKCSWSCLLLVIQQIFSFFWQVIHFYLSKRGFYTHCINAYDWHCGFFYIECFFSASYLSLREMGTRCNATLLKSCGGCFLVWSLVWQCFEDRLLLVWRRRKRKKRRRLGNVKGRKRRFGMDKEEQGTYTGSLGKNKCNGQALERGKAVTTRTRKGKEEVMTYSKTWKWTLKGLWTRTL